MIEKSIDVLFSELSCLRSEIEASLVTEHRLMFDDKYEFDSDAAKVHRMKLVSMARSVNGLHGTIHHYLSMAEIGLAVFKARDKLIAAYHGKSDRAHF